MRRMNTLKYEEPIRTPIVRLRDIPSHSSVDQTGADNTQKMSFALNIKDGNDERLKRSCGTHTDTQLLSVPQIRVQTPPVHNLRTRSNSVPSVTTDLLMEYNSAKLLNNKVDQDLIAISSRHLSLHSPSEPSHSLTQSPNVFCVDTYKSGLESSKKGHHSESGFPTACTGTSRALNKSERPVLHKSQSIWSIVEDDSSDLFKNDSQRIFSCKKAVISYENMNGRSGSSGKEEINDGIEEIYMDNQTDWKFRDVQIDKSPYSQITKNSSFFEKFKFH